MRESKRSAWIAAALVACTALLLVPMAPAILLATWCAAAGRRLHVPLTRALGGRTRLAASITVATLLLVVIPIALVLVSVAADAYDLVMRTIESHDPWRMIVDEKAQAWSIATSVAATAATVAVGIFVFIAGTFGILVDGKRWYAWLKIHAPIAPKTLDRYTAAFYETGHGLFVGIAGAGLLQSIAATIAFVALGVPHAFALGLLTLIASVLPAIGSALVWVPVAVGLAMNGNTTAAIAMGVCGIAVISTIDNLVRPLLARRGRLRLPSFVVLVSMFGGVALLGGWGLLIGPLVARLAKEALEIHAATKYFERSTDGSENNAR